MRHRSTTKAVVMVRDAMTTPRRTLCVSFNSYLSSNEDMAALKAWQHGQPVARKIRDGSPDGTADTARAVVVVCETGRSVVGAERIMSSVKNRLFLSRCA